MTNEQDSNKDMTVSTSQTKKRKLRDMTKSIAKNIKDTAIKSTKRLLGESMFVQQIIATLHKDVLIPINIKLIFEMSDKAVSFNTKIPRRNKFDTDVFREKYTVISTDYEFRDRKKLDKLPGNHDSWFKLK